MLVFFSNQSPKSPAKVWDTKYLAHVAEATWRHAKHTEIQKKKQCFYTKVVLHEADSFKGNWLVEWDWATAYNIIEKPANYMHLPLLPSNPTLVCQDASFAPKPSAFDSPLVWLSNNRNRRQTPRPNQWRRPPLWDPRHSLRSSGVIQAALAGGQKKLSAHGIYCKKTENKNLRSNKQ